MKRITVYPKKEEKVILRFNESDRNFIESHSSVINSEWYYLNMFFKKQDDGTFEALSANNLPDDIKKLFKL